MPEETMQIFALDFGIRGEGEYPMFKLVEALANNLPLRDIRVFFISMRIKTRHESCLYP